VTVVIAGSGLSGLSLLAHLAAEPRYAEQVLLVGDGECAGIRDTGWVHWTDRPGVLDGAVSRSFDRVRVHARGQSRVLGLGRYRYRYVYGDHLMAEVDRLVAAAPRVACRRGHVDEIGRTHVVVDGQAIAAHWVFDSVRGPATAHRPDAMLVLCGWHVHTERPVFDPALPTLFDFRTGQELSAAVVSVLPLGAHHALVQHAYFTPSGRHGEARHPVQREALAAYLGEVVGTESYEVLRERTSLVPLSAETVNRRRGDVLAIGGVGGVVKAGSGFAYQRIQRDSEAIVRSLVMRGDPFAIPGSRPRHRAFDGALLDSVVREPERLELALDELFRGPSAELAFRFLDEDTTVGEENRLLANAPVSAILGVGRRIRS
jgi:lycopene beta-cyclase